MRPHSWYWPCALLIFAGSAAAQNYPHRPLRLVVPYAPGGPVDIVGRITGQKLGETLAQQVIIDNRAGAGGNIALEIVAKATPDGYTLLMGANGPIAINPGLYRNMPIDTQKDLSAISMVASSAMILVAHPSLPANSVHELIALAKSKPASINYASSGSGSTAHLASELFKSMAGVRMVHVPYKGAGPALTDLVGGQVQTMFTGVSSTLPYVKSGKLKALGVSSEKRLALLPEVPAVAEQLPGYEVSTWYGVFAPAGTPDAIVGRLHEALAEGFASADAQSRLAALGADARTMDPRQFANTVAQERSKWAKIIRESGAKAD
jgi:tripartite-type tricarboxylate transporter receptor subunit TctC